MPALTPIRWFVRARRVGHELSLEVGDPGGNVTTTRVVLGRLLHPATWNRTDNDDRWWCAAATAAAHRLEAIVRDSVHDQGVVERLHLPAVIRIDSVVVGLASEPLRDGGSLVVRHFEL